MATMNIQQFQATSSTGDFQAALSEAIGKAYHALSMDVADQHIQWKIIETSDSRGGLLEEKSITVTIEAQVH